MVAGLDAQAAAAGAAEFRAKKKSLTKHSEVTAADAGTAKLTIKPSRMGLKKLKRKARGPKTGKLEVPVEVTFTPTGGSPNTLTRSYKLKLK